MSDAVMDLGVSPKVAELRDKVADMIREHVLPVDEEYLEEVNKGDRWTLTPRMVEILDSLKSEAKKRGLWNFWLTDSERGYGLTTVEYAYLAEEMGKAHLGAETFNCSAPDTGNMEVFERYGTDDMKEKWLKPLLEGEIRSAYAMTEPDVASSDATNINMSCVKDGDEWVLNGEKHWISGAGDPRCKVYITMVRTGGDDVPRHKQHSMVVVPADAEGIEILRPMQVFSMDDAPHGHMHMRFTNVRVPADAMLLGEGRGFEIAQGRLGPGRIHHCMRSIGKAERALELMVKRGASREAFGRPLIKLGGNLEKVSRARIEINAMRLAVLQAAKAMDVLGNKEARVYVSAVKAMVPEKVCQIIDQSMQVHGATGISQWSPLSAMYTHQRTLRFADGPDEVHHHVVARAEVADYLASNDRRHVTESHGH